MSGIWLVSYIALWVLVILLVVIVLGLVRQLGLIYLRLGPESHLLTTSEGLEVGLPAPEFHKSRTIHGNEISLTELKGRPSIVVFISPSCQPCQDLMPHITKFHKTRNGKVNLIVVTQAELDETIQFTKSYQLAVPVIPDPRETLSKLYQVRATPFAYRLDKEGIVQRRGVVNNIQGLEALLEEAPSSEHMVELPIPVESSKNH